MAVIVTLGHDLRGGHIEFKLEKIMQILKIVINLHDKNRSE